MEMEVEKSVVMETSGISDVLSVGFQEYKGDRMLVLLCAQGILLVVLRN
jgi:hypothetical protein